MSLLQMVIGSVKYGSLCVFAARLYPLRLFHFMRYSGVGEEKGGEERDGIPEPIPTCVCVCCVLGAAPGLTPLLPSSQDRILLAAFCSYFLPDSLSSPLFLFFFSFYWPHTLPSSCAASPVVPAATLLRLGMMMVRLHRSLIGFAVVLVRMQ